MKTIWMPEITPGSDRGKITLRNVWILVAPRSYAASDKLSSSLTRTEYKGRIMNGRKSFVMTIFVMMSARISFLRNITGASIMPHCCINVLRTPVSLKKALHAYVLSIVFIHIGRTKSIRSLEPLWRLSLDLLARI